ncbi:hypothetical protein KUTeg_006220, partial [Tegillarca granosa]
MYSLKYEVRTDQIDVQNDIVYSNGNEIFKAVKQRIEKKKTFAVKKTKVVCQIVDEADKNHRSVTSPEETVGKGRMYVRPENIMYPIRSFTKYLEKLHPDIDDLWQCPLDSYNESDLHVVKLSVIYTSHSIQDTCCKIRELDDVGVEARNIMRVSGHKSKSSIRSYLCRLSGNKTYEMSICLSNNLEGSEPQNGTNSFTCMSDLSFLTNQEIDTIFNEENERNDISQLK